MKATLSLCCPALSLQTCWSLLLVSPSCNEYICTLTQKQRQMHSGLQHPVILGERRLMERGKMDERRIITLSSLSFHWMAQIFHFGYRLIQLFACGEHQFEMNGWMTVCWAWLKLYSNSNYLWANLISLLWLNISSLVIALFSSSKSFKVLTRIKNSLITLQPILQCESHIAASYQAEVKSWACRACTH